MRPAWLLVAAFVAFVLGCASTQVTHPHMERALSALKEAATELQVAEHNKGGHRAAAQHLVDEAIREVQTGLGVCRSLACSL